MSIDQISIFLIILLTFLLFIWGHWRYDIVSIIALCLLFIADIALGGSKSDLVVDPSSIFLGFGHPAVITVAAVLVISRCLRNSGVVDLIARKIEPFSGNQLVHITTLSGVIAIFSAIMNNVGALALMLPVAIKTSIKQNRSPSIILMPLAFASILGGMITMIGTPPNIIISTFRLSYQSQLKAEAIADSSSYAAQYFVSRGINIEEFNPESFAMLDFSPVGLSIAFLGVIFIAFIGWRLIPKSSHKNPNNLSMFSIDEYITEIRIPESCKFIDLDIKETERITEHKIEILGYISKEGKLINLRGNHIIKESDRFLIKADPVELKIIMDEFNLRFTKKMRERIDDLKKNNTISKEVVINPGSPLDGRNRAYLRRRTSNTLTLMAVARQNQSINKRLRNIKFRVGDVLLIQGEEDVIENHINILQLLPLEDRDLNIGVFSKVSLAISIFSLAILFGVLGILPTTVAFIMAILLYIFTGILPVREIYNQIDWPIIILLGCMIPVSSALESTGSSQLIADLVISITSGLPGWFILGLIMIITMCLSDIVNNAATALIMAPIAVSIAMSMGVNADAFLMSVAVGASCAFLTPIGHQCNALVLGPGGYKFTDYWKMGLPLEILIVVIGTPLIMYFWPL
tara:strand:+ start:20192 stop:22090 length:1899 start_codon:yes stop_codon:yes gene_type:complete